jgi:hypothetical protein
VPRAIGGPELKGNAASSRWEQKGQAADAPATRLENKLSSHPHWSTLAPTKRRCSPSLSLAATASFILGFMGQNKGLAARLAPFAEDLPPSTADLLRRRLPSRRYMDHYTTHSDVIPRVEGLGAIETLPSGSMQPRRIFSCNIPGLTHCEHGRSTVFVSYNWFQRASNQNVYARRNSTRRKL